jgi:hypothetical protein
MLLELTEAAIYNGMAAVPTLPPMVLKTILPM